MSNSSGSKKIWILSIIAVAVIAIAAVVCTYIFRKDYDNSPALDNWKQFSEYGDLLNGGY